MLVFYVIFFLILLKWKLFIEFFRSMGVDIHGKEFVQKVTMFVCINILRHRKTKINNVGMFS